MKKVILLSALTSTMLLATNGDNMIALGAELLYGGNWGSDEYGNRFCI